MSGVNSTHANIDFIFEWQGPNRKGKGCLEGGQDTTIVKLFFENADTELTVKIPENISPATPQQFPFTCRKWDRDHCESEIFLATFTTTIEKIRGLKIKAAVDELSPYSDSRATQKIIFRSERAVPLQLPDILEAGRTYHLLVTSNNLSLAAALVKDEFDHHYALNEALKGAQEDAFKFYCNTLLPLMSVKMMQLRWLCRQQPVLEPELALNNAIEAIKNEIKKIDFTSITESAQRLRSLVLTGNLRVGNESVFFKAFYLITGPQGLANIMRSCLEGYIYHNVSPETRTIIGQLSERFQEELLG